MPVTSPDPITGIYAAVTRRAASGQTIGESERVSVLEALRMHTLNGAFAAIQNHDKGSVTPGKLADFVLLDRDLTAVEPEAICDISVTMTVIGGKVVWTG